MKPDVLAFAMGLPLIPVLYIIAGVFKLTWFTKPKTQKVIFAGCILLAIIGLANYVYSHTNIVFYLFLICPLYSFGLFLLLSLWFKNEFGREPILTGKGLSANPELQKAKSGWDDFFNFCFFFLSLGGPVILLGILIKAPHQ